MPDTPEFLAQRLISEGQKTLEFLRALSPAQWQQLIYPAGEPQAESLTDLEGLPRPESELPAAMETASLRPQATGAVATANPNAIPTPWSVHHLLAHFVSAEAGFASLLRNIVEGGSGAPGDFDIDRYNRGQVARLQSLPASDLLDKFEELRRQNAKFVAGLSQSDLAREGRHPFLGVAPLVNIIKLIYRHNGIHLRDARKLVS